MPTGYQTRTVVLGGQTRTLLYWLPDDYNPNTPVPLIFGWHGTGGDGMNTTGFGVHTAAQAAGQRVVYIGVDGLYNSAISATDWDVAQDGRDVAMFSSLYQWAVNNFCVDKSRVFSVGFSAGADMTHALACKYGDKLRAVQSYSGIYEFANCGAVIPNMRSTYSPANTDFFTETSLVATTEFYRSVLGCSATSAPIAPSPCQTYSSCAGAKEVTYCSIPGLGHRIPDNAGPDTWDFFARSR